MELLDDVGHVESHFFLLGDSVNVGAQFGTNVPLAQNHFGCTQWYS
jgi:hypothetical protein